MCANTMMYSDNLHIMRGYSLVSSRKDIDYGTHFYPSPEFGRASCG